MMGAKQMKFCGAVARALLIGVETGGQGGVFCETGLIWIKDKTIATNLPLIMV